jgi:transcriptional regulator with GAF, ATPase, and Fis domain
MSITEPHSLADPREGRLSRRLWANWWLATGVPLITALGLIALILIFAELPGRRSWPWEGTESALFLGLSVVLLVLSTHLARKQYEILQRVRGSPGSGVKAGQTWEYSRRLTAISNLTRILGSRDDLQEILDGITKTALDGFDCQQVSILLLERGGEELRICSSAGLLDKRLLGRTQKVGEGVAGRVAETGKPLILGGVIDPGQFRGYQAKLHRLTASMVVPINLRNERIGVLCISSRLPDQSYDGEDLRVLQVFSEIVAVCIRHAQRATWMRETIHGLEGTDARIPRLPRSL